MSDNIWLERWGKNTHLEKKKKMFSVVDAYLKSPPKNILDIGCGLAFESEMFQQKYDCELYLLDGDFDSTQDRNRKVNYGGSDTMAFYSKIPDLKKSWDQRGMRYEFVDASTLDVKQDTVFDLVYSFESCGFHYPVSTYIDFLKKHTDETTVFIFDIRNKTIENQKKYFDIVENLHVGHKCNTLSIKFK